MQARRVGTITLGLLSITVGIAFFLVTFFNLPIEKEILKFWPLAFISLGIEILILNHMSLKQKMYIKYDFMSFILMAIIIFLSFSTYVFSQCIAKGLFFIR